MLCSRKKSLPGKATLPFTAPGNCLFGNVLGLSLALGVGEFLELLFAHRHHRFGRALKLALRGFAAFGGKGGAGGLLLCGGLAAGIRSLLTWQRDKRPKLLAGSTVQRFF